MIPHLKTDDAVERRIIEQFSLAYLLTIERFVVMMPRKVQDFVGGIKSLNPHFPFRTFASGSSCHLLQHLVCPLIGTKIRLIKERISIQHRHQTDVIKMEPFGDHLRADQYIALMVSKRIDDILIGRFITGRVQIHSQHTSLREKGLYLIFDALGTESYHLHLSPTMGTSRRNGCMVAAVMAT